jgi:hypothetical protein
LLIRAHRHTRPPHPGPIHRVITGGEGRDRKFDGYAARSAVVRGSVTRTHQGPPWLPGTTMVSFLAAYRVS